MRALVIPPTGHDKWRTVAVVDAPIHVIDARPDRPRTSYLDRLRDAQQRAKENK